MLFRSDTDEGDLDAHPNLQLPERNTSVVDDLEATVSFDPPQLAAGRHGHVIFTVRDAGNRQPIRELQPYLGAFGHLFITDEKMVDYVHSHPVDTPSENLDPSQVHGGPTVMFEGLMPKPGRYRAWAQFKYRDKLYTFQTTFDVVEPGT